MHQLRVASVAKIICDSIENFAETDNVVIACLLHDMGNIIKFELGYFPEFLKPEGLAYWQNVKDEYIAKYGKNEVEATHMIVKEIGVSPKVFEYVNQVGFTRFKETETSPLPAQICAYADMRVGPHGVLSLDGRLLDGKKRYGGKTESSFGPQKFNALVESIKTVEEKIFQTAKIKPEAITDESIAPLLQNLKNFEIRP